MAKVPGQYDRPNPAAEQRGDERARFGINTLINRMTGQPADAAPQPVRQQPQVRATPVADEVEPMDPEQEKIEIPAFLRRQAN